MRNDQASQAASNPFEEIIDLQAFCAKFQITERTAHRWQALKTGPARIKIGRKLFYRKSAIAEWLRKREQQASAA